MRHRLVSYLGDTVWALPESSVRQFIEIAKGDNIPLHQAASKLEASHKGDGQSNGVAFHGNVAVVDIQGPLMKRGGLLDALCGITSYQSVEKALDQAAGAPQVDTVILNIDSPGGQVAGLEAFADKIHDLRENKRIVAFSDGQAASAAYWIASAAQEIYLTESASVGSIGVVATYPASDGDYIEVTSKQSPDKRIDVSSDEGFRKIQAHVSELADVFIGRVARNRGVDVNTVLEKFGQGGMLIGQTAIDAGMADGITNLEALIEKLQQVEGSPNGGFFNANEKEHELMDMETLKANHPDLVQAVQDEAVKAAQTQMDEQLAASKARINAIVNSEEATGREELAKHIAFNTEASEDDARAMLKAAPTATNIAFEQAMEKDEDVDIAASASDASPQDKYGDKSYWDNV